MATVKLTDFMRDDIRSALLQSRFGDQFDSIRDRFQALASAVYHDVYSGKVLETMSGLPEGWLPKKEALLVRFGYGSDSIVSLNFNGEPSTWRDAGVRARRGKVRDHVWLVVQNRHARHTVAKDYDLGSDLGKVYNALSKDWEALCKAVGEADALAKQALKRVTTVAKLVAEWPEVATFCQKWLDNAAVHKPPAIQVAKLNEVFDLPEDERKVA